MERNLEYATRQIQIDLNRRISDLERRLMVTESELKEVKHQLQWHNRLWTYLGEGCLLLTAYAVTGLGVALLFYWHLLP